MFASPAKPPPSTPVTMTTTPTTAMAMTPNSAGIDHNHRFAGVGILLEPNGKGELQVCSMLPLGPAEQSGLIQNGDVIKEIDGTNVHRAPVGAVREALLGRPGSSVVLTFIRGCNMEVRVRLQRTGVNLALHTSPPPAAISSHHRLLMMQHSPLSQPKIFQQQQQQLTPSCRQQLHFQQQQQPMIYSNNNSHQNLSQHQSSEELIIVADNAVDSAPYFSAGSDSNNSGLSSRASMASTKHGPSPKTTSPEAINIGNSDHDASVDVSNDIISISNRLTPLAENEHALIVLEKRLHETQAALNLKEKEFQASQVATLRLEQQVSAFKDKMASEKSASDATIKNLQEHIVELQTALDAKSKTLDAFSVSFFEQEQQLKAALSRCTCQGSNNNNVSSSNNNNNQMGNRSVEDMELLLKDKERVIGFLSEKLTQILRQQHMLQQATPSSPASMAVSSYLSISSSGFEM